MTTCSRSELLGMGGAEFEATRLPSQWPLTIQWPHFKSAFKNVGRRHHWIFVKRPVGSVQPRLRWQNKVFSKDLEVSRPIFGSGASKTRSFQETSGISSCVSGDQNLHFIRKHFGFLTWKQVFFVPKPKPEHKQSIVMREKLEIGPTEKHKAATIKTVTLETS